MPRKIDVPKRGPLTTPGKIDTLPIGNQPLPCETLVFEVALRYGPGAPPEGRPNYPINSREYTYVPQGSGIVYTTIAQDQHRIPRDLPRGG